MILNTRTLVPLLPYLERSSSSQRGKTQGADYPVPLVRGVPFKRVGGAMCY